MIYAKHPTKGNAHFPDSERAALEADGWVIWPRTSEQKAPLAQKVAAPLDMGAVVSSPRSAPEPVGAAPKRQGRK